MHTTITLGAALVALAVTGCLGQEPARSPKPAGDLEGVADKTSEGLEQNGSTINTSGESTGEKAMENREERPPPTEKPRPQPSPEPAP
jgi:hypothetical protein